MKIFSYDYLSYEYDPLESYKYYEGPIYSDEYGSGSSYTVNRASQTKEDKLEKEIKDNIPKRALMLQKASDYILALPQLPPELWKEIAEYEGGVESSLLGNTQDSDASCCCSWCSIQ